jgi:hypothetical protein
MEKLLTLLALKLIVKDGEKVVKLYNSIYPQKPQNMGSVSKPKKIPVVKTKKDELIESLQYLKSKKTKTKKDKESINIIESVIKNM